MNKEILRRNFEKHGFTAHFFQNKEEAAGYLVQNIKGQTVGFGGSVTLEQMNLYELLSNENTVFWHHKSDAPEIRRLASSSKVYITGVNALTEEGEIINIDGRGNRVAATAFGPDACYYVVGKNKITKNLAEGLSRCRNIAAPKNAKRLGAKTPCALKGDKCYDCYSPARICRLILITERAPFGMHSEILFIDEELGL